VPLPSLARRVLHLTSVAVAATLSVVGLVCVVPGPTGAQATLSTGLVADDPQVVVVSLDGLNPHALRRLGRTGVPHLWRLFDEGAGTLDARTQVELTVTLPNHTSMVTGRRINARKGGHGVTWNDDRLRPRTVQKAAGHPVSSVFTKVSNQGGSTALYAAKTKFRLWDRSWPTDIDRMGIYEEDDAAVMTAARADLVTHDRQLTFVHLGAADKAGHSRGWMTPAYLVAVRSLDTLVGQLLADADAEPDLADLTIVLTADHGGVPGARSHSDLRRPANFTIPFVVWGPDIDHADLYAINPGYARPAKKVQPRLTGKQPVRNGNVANLALELLGYGPVPGSLYGRTRPLQHRG
jgi:hypothetical protein